MTQVETEQLVRFLSDMYSLELQALAQLVSAPEMVEEPHLAAGFRQHCQETEKQAELVRERLEALGGSPSTVKDAIMKLGGKGFLLFARIMPETPGRLLTHAYSYEALEWAGYDMLVRFAQHQGDHVTEEVARSIQMEEHQMMQRLHEGFDLVEQLCHGQLHGEQLEEHVIRHLAETHAFEEQGIQLLEKGVAIAGCQELSAIYQEELQLLNKHGRKVEQRLDELGSKSSAFKDASMKLGGLNWGLFFQSQADTPAKLAAFVYAYLHLEIGGYELLKRTCERAGDSVTRGICDEIIHHKQSTSDRLSRQFETAVRATLGELDN